MISDIFLNERSNQGISCGTLSQVNSMWIVKNSTSLLSSLDQLDVHTPTSVQTYDFFTLYTSIPHNLLKSRITALIHNSFKRRNGSNRCTRIEITNGKGYFTDTISPGGDNLYTADQICRMVEFLIDNIFVNPIPGGGGGGMANLPTHWQIQFFALKKNFSHPHFFYF